MTDIDGLSVRISGRPEDRRTLTILTASLHDEPTGVWLATVYRLATENRSALLRHNYRHRKTLVPRRDLLIKSAIDFQARIRAGEVAACIDQP